MNDFSELEKELRKLRPAQPSPMLFERVGDALKNGRASAATDAAMRAARSAEDTPEPLIGFAMLALSPISINPGAMNESRDRRTGIRSTQPARRISPPTPPSSRTIFNAVSFGFFLPGLSRTTAIISTMSPWSRLSQRTPPCSHTTSIERPAGSVLARISL